MRLNKSASCALVILALGAVPFTVRTAQSAGQSGALVRLQSSSPGVVQNGNLNVGGTGIFGGVRVPSGTVGIGTSSPSTLLSLGTSILDTKLALFDGVGDVYGLGVGPSQLRVHTGNSGGRISFLNSPTGTELMTIGGTGNVGINTSTPGARLHVNNGATGVGVFVGNLTPFGQAGFETSFSTAATHLWFAEGGNRVASVTPGGAAYFAGNLGVGIATPSARVHAQTSTGGAGVFRSFDPNAGVVDSITAQSSSGNGAGIYTYNSSATGQTQGVYSEVSSPAGVSIYGQNLVANNTGFGLYGSNPSATGWAVFAAGRSAATGTKSFVIDHPLDPQNKVLLHYSSESPEPQNFYNGIVRTDERGYATITLPDYYEAINREPRYTLTVLDEGDSDSFVLAKVVQKVKNGQFVIRTSAPQVEVSWEIKAMRNDRWVQVNGAPTEVEKTEAQRGKYLAPDLYNQPQSMGTFYRGAPLSRSAKK